MPSFEVVVLGVGDTFSAHHHSTALLLVCDGFHLAVDCPDMYRGVLRAAAERAGRNLEISHVDHVLITHVHGDHVNGLEGVAFYKHFIERKPLTLLSSPEVLAGLWDERLRASMGTIWNGTRFETLSFADYFAPVALAWDAEITVGPFRITARRTIHHVPTSALRVTAAGRTLGYSADTAFDPQLIDFLAPADLIIHETSFGPAHTPYAALAALPAELRARMRLIHYPDSFDPAASAIRALREGEVLVP